MSWFPFSFPNQLCITVASQIWGGGGIKNKRRKTFCCVLAGEANSSKCSLMHYSQKKTVLVLTRPVCPGNSRISSNRVGTMLPTHQCLWRQPWAFLSVMTVGTINVGSSLARRCFTPPAWLSGSHSGQLTESWSDWWSKEPGSSNLPLKTATSKSKVTESFLHLCGPEV